MAYEFMSLAEVEALPEVPENATVLAEVDGSIKRIPGEGLGGSGNNLVIVESSFTDYYNPSEVSEQVGLPSYTYTANMEFADALAAFRACELTNAVLYAFNNGPIFMNCAVMDCSPMTSVDCLCIVAELLGKVYIALYWTADGISTEAPPSSEA